MGTPNLMLVTIGYILITIIPSLALTVRRFYDTGNSGWMLLLRFVPIIGGVIIFMVLASDDGTNQYGSNPKEIDWEVYEESIYAK